MIYIKSFCFNPFYENTYVLYDETKESAIIDPGCYTDEEKQTLYVFIKDQKLTPVILLNTHCHIDHILGNNFVCQTFRTVLALNRLETGNLNLAAEYGAAMGVLPESSPQPERFLEEGDRIKFGKSELKILFTPGHSEGSICFYNAPEKILVGGDVLFEGSIGRYDLPGGDYDTLMKSIAGKLMPLPDDTRVYPGHGNPTAIGKEKKYNPFLVAMEE